VIEMVIAFIVVQGLAIAVGFWVARNALQKREEERRTGVYRELQ